ncbi:Conserved hypothetical protein [Micromonospora lupini str. Lupac 08]|uniref:Uncharacterized protein n=1 Tax=Micromonospora lupini str. Lupac 08 TaxID=1150864 RepID=I0L254_9ACTN|nr:Conserved hypothetical protein [Micromonospora lupini str. Lupac 08]
MNLIASGKAEPSFLVSHELTLDEAPMGYQNFDARNDGWTKVLLHPDARRWGAVRVHGLCTASVGDRGRRARLAVRSTGDPQRTATPRDRRRAGGDPTRPPGPGGRAAHRRAGRPTRRPGGRRRAVDCPGRLGRGGATPRRRR